MKVFKDLLSMMKVWVTDTVHQLLLNGLKERGHHVQYDPKISLDAVREDISSWDGIIINSKIIMDRSMMERAGQLKFIGRLGSGLDIIDLETAEERSIEVLRAPEGNRNAVAEHVLGMLLALLNHLCRADREVRTGRWEREHNRGRELAGSTVGIIGYGNNGRAFAEKLSGMDVELLVYDKYKRDFETDFIREVDLEEIREQADIISFHVPLTDETRYMCDRTFIEKCQPGVIILNIARGEIIETKSLLEGLRNDQIGGVCLDVLEHEPPEAHEQKELYDSLFAMEQVMLSPHIAGWTVASKKRIAEVLLDKIIEFEKKRFIN